MSQFEHDCLNVPSFEMIQRGSVDDVDDSDPLSSMTECLSMSFQCDEEAASQSHDFTLVMLSLVLYDTIACREVVWLGKSASGPKSRMLMDPCRQINCTK